MADYKYVLNEYDDWGNEVVCFISDDLDLMLSEAIVRSSESAFNTYRLETWNGNTRLLGFRFFHNGREIIFDGGV